MAGIDKYTIDVPGAKLDRLRRKLEIADLPEYEIEGAGWKYGVPVLPHFKKKVEVEGFGELGVHFLHQVSENKNAVPLLFIHGWPGSFLEVTRMLPGLKGGDGKPAFNVVAPSLPNYCFSEGVKKPGFELKHYAETCHSLMLKLGYNQYVVQGGDWGFLISRAICHLYPGSCKAMHTNWIFASPPTWTAESLEPEYSDREKAALARAQDWWAGEGRGYLAIQSTKPATIAHAHRDPIALLTWIYEKLVSWSDSYAWTDDEVLTWVSLYYFSDAGPEASSYHYYEGIHGSVITVPVVQSYIDVPLGLADFPVEISHAPRAWWGTLGPVVFSKSYDKGGHFAGWQRPQDVADGLCEMFGKGGGAFWVVEGKNGY